LLSPRGLLQAGARTRTGAAASHVPAPRPAPNRARAALRAEREHGGRQAGGRQRRGRPLPSPPLPSAVPSSLGPHLRAEGEHGGRQAGEQQRRGRAHAVADHEHFRITSDAVLEAPVVGGLEGGGVAAGVPVPEGVDHVEDIEGAKGLGWEWERGRGVGPQVGCGSPGRGPQRTARQRGWFGMGDGVRDKVWKVRGRGEGGGGGGRWDLAAAAAARPSRDGVPRRRRAPSSRAPAAPAAPAATVCLHRRRNLPQRAAPVGQPWRAAKRDHQHPLMRAPAAAAAAASCGPAAARAAAARAATAAASSGAAPLHLEVPRAAALHRPHPQQPRPRRRRGREQRGPRGGRLAVVEADRAQRGRRGAGGDAFQQRVHGGARQGVALQPQLRAGGRARRGAAGGRGRRGR
jgi:hypothetical protein